MKKINFDFLHMLNFVISVLISSRLCYQIQKLILNVDNNKFKMNTEKIGTKIRYGFPNKMTSCPLTGIQ